MPVKRTQTAGICIIDDILEFLPNASEYVSTCLPVLMSFLQDTDPVHLRAVVYGWLSFLFLSVVVNTKRALIKSFANIPGIGLAAQASIQGQEGKVWESALKELARKIGLAWQHRFSLDKD